MEKYTNVIDIISKEQNWKEIVIEIAKINPEIVIEVFENSLTLENRCKNLIRKGYKINAIKLYRDENNKCNLRDAKDYIKYLAEKINYNE